MKLVPNTWCRIEGSTERSQLDSQKVNEIIQEKTRVLHDLEARLKLEQEFIITEKKRLDKIRNSLADQEEAQRSYLENEKNIIRQEYKRLAQMQEDNREIEAERKRELAAEKKKQEDLREQWQ